MMKFAHSVIDLIDNLTRIENFMYLCMYINMYLRYLDRLAAQFSFRLF